MRRSQMPECAARDATRRERRRGGLHLRDMKWRLSRLARPPNARATSHILYTFYKSVTSRLNWSQIE